MSRTLDSRPAADGFTMPAEWEPHAGCWMAWPERPDTWRLGAGRPRQAFAAVAAAIAAAEPVTVGASAGQVDRARALLPAAVRGGRAGHRRRVDARHRPDLRGRRRTVPRRGRRLGVQRLGRPRRRALRPVGRRRPGRRRPCSRYEGVDRYRAPLVLEGGSIHVDGEGTLLTTEECLLNRNRNPSLDRGQIERHLRDHTGAETIIWLGAGVYRGRDRRPRRQPGLLRAARRGGAHLVRRPVDDPQHAISLDARRRLEAAADARGRSLEVHLVHQPGPLSHDRRPRPPASTPAPVPSPGRAVPAWRPATSTSTSPTTGSSCRCSTSAPTTPPSRRIAGLFPERQVVGVATREILLGGGNIHCITQQVPG